MVKDDNYVTVQGWMRNLGLSGNRLLAFAIIYGFSQDENSVFSGSASYIADWLGITKRAVFDILKDLTDMGLVEKIEKNVNNMVVYDYRATSQGVKKLHGGSEKTSLGGSEKTSPHNNSIDNNRDIDVIGDSPVATTTASQFDRFVKWWNEVLIPVEDNKVGNIVKIQVRSQKRIQMFKSRWKETRDYLRAKGKEIDDDAVFKYMTEEVVGGNYLNSDWLRGLVTGNGYQNPYKVEFDNIFSPKMWTGMLEKKYYNRELDRVKYSD